MTHSCEKWNWKMYVNTSHQTTILVKPDLILQRKCPLVFPLMFDDCSACLEPFILAELSPATTQCSFGHACCFQEPPWITELWQSSRKDIISIKYDTVLLELLFYVTCECASLSFVFWSSGSHSKLHSVALMSLSNLQKESNKLISQILGCDWGLPTLTNLHSSCCLHGLFVFFQNLWWASLCTHWLPSDTTVDFAGLEAWAILTGKNLTAS